MSGRDKSRSMTGMSHKDGPGAIAHKGRYDVWSRRASDAFRWEATELLLPGALETHSDCNRDPYAFFSSLGEVTWTDRSASSMALNQVRAFFSKDEDMRSPIDTEQVAYDSFMLSEEMCKATNDRIISGELTVGNRDAACILHYAQRKIALILGDAPSLEDLDISFGPGAAVTCRNKTTARHKLSTPPSIGEPAVAIAGRLATKVQRWYDLFGTVVVRRGALQFVNKNFKTKRTIVIGPSLTGMFQRAVGAHMKHKMLRAGIDLYDQSINRERARLASMTGKDATIDLKMASDLNAYMLVMELFPQPWFELLDGLRDSSLEYQGRVIQLEKFSSMGNGYTFELESLLFYSLAYGISKHYDLPFDLTVFGDDLVCNTALARKILECFPWFGLLPNTEKSYLEGPFRESCGGDYVLGVDVRPFFIRGRMTIHRAVCMYNHFMRKPHQDPGRKLRDLCLTYVPDRYRIFGPDNYGDGHLIGDDPDVYLKPYGRKKGWCGYIFETYIETPTRSLDDVPGDVLLPSYQAAQYPKLDLVKSQIKEDLAVNYRLVKGQYRDSFIRHFIEDHSPPIDHYVIRKARNGRTKAKKVRIYVLGAP